ncbi:MAG: helix-turn-helix domain-containing protein, partial [Pseudomonadaceae bacterium]|nr:helix-turn-helix domain-containing protein [Pseudomonadaceae bacterium]
MDLKDRFKAARTHAGLTQGRLAERIGIKQASISEIERGLTSSSGHLVRVAIECGVDPLWLSEGAGEMLAVRTHGPDENGSPSKKEYALIPQYTARASAGKGYHNDHVELSEGQGLVF